MGPPSRYPTRRMPRGRRNGLPEGSRFQVKSLTVPAPRMQLRLPSKRQWDAAAPIHRLQRRAARWHTFALNCQQRGRILTGEDWKHGLAGIRPAILPLAAMPPCSTAGPNGRASATYAGAAPDAATGVRDQVRARHRRRHRVLVRRRLPAWHRWTVHPASSRCESSTLSASHGALEG